MRVVAHRIPRLALGVAVATIAVLAGSSSSALAATQGECTVHSLPSFVSQGFGANAAGIADVVEVACFREAGQPVTIEDAALSAHCGGNALD
jgi:hypothetical protein